MKKPTLNIFGGDYDYNLNQSYNIQFYEGRGSLTEQILNYNFNPVAFYCNGEGKLFLARIFHGNFSQKLGDYPIIDTAEATRLLLEGRYYTTIHEEIPKEEYIRKVELIYRTGDYEEYFLPYYCFFVELPDYEYRPKNGTNGYGIYYVPAVDDAYISNLSVGTGYGH